jgi:hypothetical protein
VDGTRDVEVASPAFGPCFERRAVAMKSDGKDVQGYQWARVPRVAEAQCRNW